MYLTKQQLKNTRHLREEAALKNEHPIVYAELLHARLREILPFLTDYIGGDIIPMADVVAAHRRAHEQEAYNGIESSRDEINKSIGRFLDQTTGKKGSAVQGEVLRSYGSLQWAIQRLEETISIIRDASDEYFNIPLAEALKRPDFPDSWRADLMPHAQAA